MFCGILGTLEHLRRQLWRMVRNCVRAGKSKDQNVNGARNWQQATDLVKTFRYWQLFI